MKKHAALAAAAAIAASLITAPAHAQTETFGDPADAAAPVSDIRRVVVNNATTNNRVTVRANMGAVIYGDSAILWLDTKAADAGPEYKLRLYPESDGFTLRRVNRFTGNGKAVPCSGMRLRAVTGQHETFTWSFPRNCLKNPGKLRATVRARWLFASKVVIDWAPGSHRFTGWVARG
jgi:hypothetical protein